MDKRMNRRSHSDNPSLLRAGGFMNVEFALKAIGQILNIFDLDLGFQSHINDLKLLL